MGPDTRLLAPKSSARGRASRASALLAYARSGGRAALPAVVEGLLDADLEVVRVATLALYEMGPTARPAVSVLLALALNPDPCRRRLGLETAVYLSPEQAMPALCDALGDADAEVRRTAARCIFNCGPLARVAAERLRGALEDTDAIVRLVAAETLAGLERLPHRGS